MFNATAPGCSTWPFSNLPIYQSASAGAAEVETQFRPFRKDRRVVLLFIVNIVRDRGDLGLCGRLATILAAEFTALWSLHNAAIGTNMFSTFPSRKAARGAMGMDVLMECVAALKDDAPIESFFNIVAFDNLIREIANTVDLKDTLLLFTADHSFDLRIHNGLRTDPILKGLAEWRQTHKASDPIDLPVLRVNDSHTGEEVLAAAQGPGAEQVNGFFPNTKLFQVMMNAYGWPISR